MAKAKFRVEVVTRKEMTAGKPVTVGLKVEDHASGEVLALIDFTASEWLELTTGLNTTKEGFVSSHLERVGRKQVVRQVAIPRDAVTRYNVEEAEVQAKKWAVEQTGLDETVEVRRTNAGWVAIYRSWPEVTK